MRFNDAGGAGSGSRLAAGYWVGPGNWVYYVSADQSVQAVYSGKSRTFLYKQLDAATAGAVRNELMQRGKHYGSSSRDAYTAVGASLSGGTATTTGRSSPYTAAAVTPAAVLEPVTSKTDYMAYAPYAILGAGILVAGGILLFGGRK